MSFKALHLFAGILLLSTLAGSSAFAGKGNCKPDTLKRAEAGLTSMGTECACVKVKGTGKEAVQGFACKLAGKGATVFVGREGAGVKDQKAVEKAYLGEAMCKAACGG